MIASVCFLLPLTTFAGEAEVVAANELLQAIQFEKTMEKAKEMSIQMIVQMNPAISKYESIIKEFYNKNMDAKIFREEIISIYADVFTKSELEAITAFYNTETGQKALEKLPEIMQRAMQLSSARVMEHQNELIEMITQAQSEEKSI